MNNYKLVNPKARLVLMVYCDQCIPTIYFCKPMPDQYYVYHYNFPLYRSWENRCAVLT